MLTGNVPEKLNQVNPNKIPDGKDKRPGKCFNLLNYSVMSIRNLGAHGFIERRKNSLILEDSDFKIVIAENMHKQLG